MNDFERNFEDYYFDYSSDKGSSKGAKEQLTDKMEERLHAFLRAKKLLYDLLLWLLMIGLLTVSVRQSMDGYDAKDVVFWIMFIASYVFGCFCGCNHFHADFEELYFPPRYIVESNGYMSLEMGIGLFFSYIFWGWYSLAAYFRRKAELKRECPEALRRAYLWAFSNTPRYIIPEIAAEGYEIRVEQYREHMRQEHERIAHRYRMHGKERVKEELAKLYVDPPTFVARINGVNYIVHERGQSHIRIVRLNEKGGLVRIVAEAGSGYRCRSLEKEWSLPQDVAELYESHLMRLM